MACGALSLVGGCAPAEGILPSAHSLAPAHEELPAPTLRWRLPDASSTVVAVELAGADSVALSALRQLRVPRECWTSFLSVRVVSERQNPSEPVPPLLGSYRL